MKKKTTGYHMDGLIALLLFGVPAFWQCFSQARGHISG